MLFSAFLVLFCPNPTSIVCKKWQKMAFFGHFWPFLAIFGQKWAIFAIFGSPRLPTQKKWPKNRLKTPIFWKAHSKKSDFSPKTMLKNIPTGGRWPRPPLYVSIAEKRALYFAKVRELSHIWTLPFLTTFLVLFRPILRYFTPIFRYLLRHYKWHKYLKSPIFGTFSASSTIISAL